MKLAKITKNLIGILAPTAILFTGSAFAGVNCPSANISKIGVYPYLPETVKYAVYATCSDTTIWSGEKMFFIAKDDLAESFYAAGLVAVSMGNSVDIITTSASNYGTVKMLSVSKINN